MQVLVIGGGPSHKLHYDECKKFKGIIVACDRPAKALLQHGVIPNYIVTSEAAKELSSRDFFYLEETKKHDIEIIVSRETRHELLEAFKENGIKWSVYDPLETQRIEPTLIPNVGMCSLHWVRNVLKPDNIVLLGFETEGDEYTEFVFRCWQGAFWYWVEKWGDNYIINCSEGGKLYGKWKGIPVRSSTLKQINSSV